MTSGNLQHIFQSSQNNCTQFPLQNWTYIRTDRHEFRQIYDRGPDGRLRSEEPFYLRMDEIEDRLGTANGVQIRAEAWVTDYFYNNTQACIDWSNF